MSDPIVRIILRGPPRGKGRPRFGRVGKFVRVYSDAKTAAYEAKLRGAGRVAMGSRKPFDEPLTVMVTAFVGMPASFSKRKRAEALDFTIMPGKPDLDNYEKAALDALNEIVWRDDSLIVSMSSQKVYSENPRLEIKVWRWL